MDSLMTIGSREVLQTAVAQLCTLAAFLREQLDQYAEGSATADRREARACRELLRSLAALIPPLQAACDAGVRSRSSRTAITAMTAATLEP